MNYANCALNFILKNYLNYGQSLKQGLLHFIYYIYYYYILYYIYLTFNIIFNIINHFRGFIHKSSLSEGWSMIFPGADRSVTLRTQRFLYEKYKQRPAQVQTYFTLK